MAMTMMGEPDYDQAVQQHAIEVPFPKGCYLRQANPLFSLVHFQRHAPRAAGEHLAWRRQTLPALACSTSLPWPSRRRRIVKWCVEVKTAGELAVGFWSSPLVQCPASPAIRVLDKT
jgi:hypothetical protein